MAERRKACFRVRFALKPSQAPNSKHKAAVCPESELGCFLSMHHPPLLPPIPSCFFFLLFFFHYYSAKKKKKKSLHVNENGMGMVQIQAHTICRRRSQMLGRACGPAIRTDLPQCRCLQEKGKNRNGSMALVQRLGQAGQGIQLPLFQPHEMPADHYRPPAQVSSR